MKQILIRPHVVARRGIGCGSPAARELAECYANYGYTVISADRIRDENTKENKNWDLNVSSKVLEKLNAAIAQKKSVFLDMDMSSFKNKIWLNTHTLMKADVDYKKINSNKADVLAWLELATDEELAWCLPWYFQNHTAKEFDKYDAGPVRGRVVAGGEIKKYEYWRD